MQVNINCNETYELLFINIATDEEECADIHTYIMGYWAESGGHTDLLQLGGVFIIEHTIHADAL